MYKNVLSLDPMFSPLHEQLAERCNATKRYALLSNLGLRRYLSSFEKRYIHRAILNTSLSGSQLDSVSIENVDFHYKSYVDKVLKRSLTDVEVDYFKKFYYFLSGFLKDKNIDLVLFHNDRRWQHAIAMDICKKLSIQYLVTEQGILRPYTTVIDSVGVNSNSSLQRLFVNYVERSEVFSNLKTALSKEDVLDSHDSYGSKVNFGKFLILNKLSNTLNYTAQFQHKSYSFKEYIKRYASHRQSGNPSASKERDLSYLKNKKVIFFPMQLSNDTQILNNSTYSNMEDVLKVVEAAVECLNSRDAVLVVKKHPNDQNEYSFSNETLVINNASTIQLIEYSRVVVLVNSSVAYEVIKTDKPLVSLGEASFNINGIANQSRGEDLWSILEDALENPNDYVDMDIRSLFIDFITNIYSVYGAGYCYSQDELDRALKLNGLIST